MPIKGLNRNRQAPGLARAGVIRLGLKVKKCKACGHIFEAAASPCPECGGTDFSKDFPREADHFVLTDAPGVAEILSTDRPTELKIYFPFDEVNEVFPHYMQYWSATSLVCRGDGEMILHAIEATQRPGDGRDGLALVDFSEGRQQFSAGQSMPCPGLERDLYPKCAFCKPNAILVIMLREVPRLAYYQITTTSINNIINIPEQLNYVREQVRRLTGEARITGVPFILRRVKKSISAPKTDRNGNQIGRQRVEKWFLELEIEPEWIQRMVRAMAKLSDPMSQLDGALPPPAASLPEPAPEVDYFEEPPEWEPRYDDEAIEGKVVVDELPSEPEPAPHRPVLPPLKVREYLHRKAKESDLRDQETGDYFPVNLHQFNHRTPKLVAAKFQEAFQLAGAELPAAPDQMYHIALKWLFGVVSANDLLAAQADALLDWLLNSHKREQFRAPIAQPAPAEALAIYTEATSQSGI